MKAYIFSKNKESVRIVKGIPDNIDIEKAKTDILKKMSLTKKANTLIFVSDNMTVDKTDYDTLMSAKSTRKAKTADPETIVAYTDGGYHIYKNEGAFAFVLLKDGKIIAKKAQVIRNESNNRGELKAIIAAVRSCPDGATVKVHSDSQYAINTLNGTWARRANTDLFIEWDALLERKKVSVELNWVRGHDGNKYNEMCDRMCNEAIGYDLNSWIPKKKKA